METSLEMMQDIGARIDTVKTMANELIESKNRTIKKLEGILRTEAEFLKLLADKLEGDGYTNTHLIRERGESLLKIADA